MTLLGLAHDHDDRLTDGILVAIEASAAELGIQTTRISRPDEEKSVDILLMVGYPRSYATFLEAPRSAHRIAWFGEPLPRLASTASSLARNGACSTQARKWGLRAAARIAGPVTRVAIPGPLGVWRQNAAIAHEQSDNLAQAQWCARRVDRIVVTSRDRGQVLALSGVDAQVVPFGYHPVTWGALTPPNVGPRDIGVAIIGSGLGSRRLRRARVLARLRPQLERLAPVAELEGIWGDDRSATLRRSRVVLDIQRVPGNFAGLRFLLALSAGAVVATEPVDDPYPFEPLVDHVSAPADSLVPAIAMLLSDEGHRCRLASTGQARLANELSMPRALARVLDA